MSNQKNLYESGILIEINTTPTQFKSQPQKMWDRYIKSIRPLSLHSITHSLLHKIYSPK